MEQNTRKKRFGDRREGRRLRSLDYLFSFIPFIMPTIVESTNYFSASVELTAAERYIRKKRDGGFKGFGMLHIFIAGYVRLVSQYPAINRFVSGKRVYARNDVEIIMTVKKKMTSSAEEAEFKVHFNPADTVDIVYERINTAIAKIKNEEMADTEKVAKLLGILPRPLLSAAIRLIKILDYYGILPKFILEASPFHGTMVITDLGSLGIPPIFHHLYNIGNAPVFISFGAKRKACVLNGEGVIQEKKYMDYTAATDERICDGYTYALAFRFLDYLLRNPEQLETPPEKVVEDID